MPVLGDREDVFKFFNNTGAGIVATRLVAINGYNVATRSVTAALAQANGTNLRADGLAVGAIGNQRMGRAYREWIAEGVNTAGRAVGDPVYLDPTTAGTWTFTRPTGVGQDQQEVGVVLTVNAATGRILFQLAAGGVDGFGSEAIDDSRLASKMYRDLGTAGVAWIEITGAVTNGDRVTVGTRIYEFDTDAPPGVTGAGADIRVGVSGVGGDQANTAAGCTTALVAAINGDASRVANAVDIGGNVVGLVALTAASTTNFAVANTIDAGGVINISAATASDASDREVQNLVMRAHTITAAEVAELARSLGTNEIALGSFANAGQPAIMYAQARSAAGREINLDGATLTLRQANGAFWILAYAEPAAGALLVAGDVVTFGLQRAT